MTEQNRGTSAAYQPVRNPQEDGPDVPCTRCGRDWLTHKHPKPSLPERLALALREDCFTELDDHDIANIVQAVVPVAVRYGARDVLDV